MRALLVVFLAAGTWAALPKDWQTCKLGSNGYDDCLRRAIKSAMMSLKNGNKQLGVNPIDPFKVSSMSIKQMTGPVGIDLDFKDMDIEGMSRCELTAVKNDWKTIEADSVCKNITITSNYKIYGKVLTLAIKGEGKSKVQIGYLEATLYGTFKDVERGGKKYFELASYDMKLDMKDVKFNFENLFNGNKELSDNMNTFLNENADLIIKELNPAISKAFIQAYTLVAKKVFSKIPSNEINV